MRNLMILTLILPLAAPVEAKEHVVKMLNKGEAGVMVFEPALVKAAVGDTVKFVPTNPSHNAESIPTMLPAGATPFKGKINQEVSVTFDKPGVYGIKCLPHLAMGMVGLVQVGNASPNLADAKAAADKLPGLAKKRMGPLVASVK